MYEKKKKKEKHRTLYHNFKEYGPSQKGIISNKYTQIIELCIGKDRKMKSNASYFLYAHRSLDKACSQHIQEPQNKRIRIMDMHMVMPYEILNNSFIVAASSYFKASRHQHCLMMTRILPQQPKS